MPSIGSWAILSTVFGSGMPAASRMVGPTSMTWVNWAWRRPGPASPRPGHDMTIGSRVPPRWLAVGLSDFRGVQGVVHAAAMWGGVVASQGGQAAVLLDELELLRGVEDQAIEVG